MAEKKSKVAELKTKPTAESVAEFIKNLPDEKKRDDAFALSQMMQEVTGENPVLWGSAIIGFGNKRYKSPSGREVDWFLVGFAPRKANFSLYLSVSVSNYPERLKDLGKYKTGGGCLYINKLADVNVDVLKEMIGTAYRANKAKA